MIHLEPVTKDNIIPVTDLEMEDSQKGFVEDNLFSLAECWLYKEFIPKAIYDDDTLIGFVLYYLVEGDPDYVFLHRIMIDKHMQGKGYGKILLDHALEKAAALSCGAICFEGNIGFYGKSGFTFARNFSLRYHGLPAGADDSFFLCKELIPGYLDGVTGEYAAHPGYLVDEQAAAEFDKLFPPKEKLKLPGQLF